VLSVVRLVHATLEPPIVHLDSFPRRVEFGQVKRTWTTTAADHPSIAKAGWVKGQIRSDFRRESATDTADTSRVNPRIVPGGNYSVARFGF